MIASSICLLTSTSRIKCVNYWKSALWNFKSREVEKYDERRNKNIIHVIYLFMIIQNHIENFISMMIIKFNQHLIILKKSWMKKQDVKYHDYDDSILFHLNHCNYLKASEYLFSNILERFQSQQSHSRRTYHLIL
jgi:hypothetical protein